MGSIQSRTLLWTPLFCADEASRFRSDVSRRPVTVKATGKAGQRRRRSKTRKVNERKKGTGKTRKSDQRVNDETYISAKQPKKKAHPWVSSPYGNQRWAQSLKCPSSEGSKAPGRLTHQTLTAFRQI